MRRIAWLGLLLMLVGCVVIDKPSMPTEPAQTPMLVVSTPAPTVAVPTVTSIPTAAPTAMPTVAPRPVLTRTQIGSFVLARAFDAGSYDSLPAVQIPDWIKTSGAKETWYLTHTLESYTPLAGPSGTKKEVFNSHYTDFVVSADDFLGQYPDSDGTIPVLMMLGHLHSFQVGWYWGRSPKLLGQEYEQAITLLLKHHPERLPYILNDLIDMGLPVDWVKSTDLGIKGFEALLFTYQFKPLFGEPKGQLYAFVRDHNQPWKFAPLPTWYDSEGTYQYGVKVNSIADINHDGRDEILVALEHAYADGWGLRLHVFAWQDGEWADRMAWNPLSRLNAPDAFGGSFWLENSNRSGLDNIVVHYWPTGGVGVPASADIYQWNGTTYTDGLPIKTQMCGYHALAEAERRRTLGDYAGALPWYSEARTRWRAEMISKDSPCRRDFQPNSLEIELSYNTELDLQRSLGKKYQADNACMYYASSLRTDNQSLLDIPQETGIQTETLTATLKLYQVRVNLTECSGQRTHVVGRFHLFDTMYSQTLKVGGEMDCSMDRLPIREFTSQKGNGLSDLRQVTQWRCSAYDSNYQSTFEQNGPTIETTCLWDGTRYALSSNQVISPSVVITGSLANNPPLIGIDQTLMNLVDCSGDK